MRKHKIMIDTNSFALSFSADSLPQFTLPSLPSLDLENSTLLNVLEQFPDLISGIISVNKKVHPFEHSIDVQGPPKAFRRRRINPEKTCELNKQLDEMLRLKIIRSSTSPWASPVHLVKKKDDSTV